MKAEDYEKVVKAMDGINVQLMVNVSGATGERLKQMLDVIRNSPYPDRMVVFTNINFREPVGPGFGAKTAKQIEEDVKNGAKGLGEIMKNFGLTAKKVDGIAPASRRSRTRSDLGHVRAAQHPGAHSHGRSARSSFSRSTFTTSAGSSWRSIPIAATTTARSFRRSKS